MAGNGLYIFGEVLYDIFPDGQQVLGGAPFNVAWHAQAFGLAPHFISRVGNDAEGDRIIAAMRNWEMQLDGLQQDAVHPTGRVQVSLTADNEPSYNIVPDSAWDFIDSAALPACADCRLLYHGTGNLKIWQSKQFRDSFEVHRISPLCHGSVGKQNLNKVG